MEFQPSERSLELLESLTAFAREEVEPATPDVRAELAADPSPHADDSPTLARLRASAKDRGLWNLFMRDTRFGPGLSHSDYAPLCEVMGRVPFLAAVTNCAAPHTGNMELLAEFGTPEQQAQWLQPLLDGSIRSCFSMTEPWVASSDGANMESRIETVGDSYVVSAHKWWSTGAMSPRCAIAIVMAVIEPDAPRHLRHSMILVPIDTPGVRIVRPLSVFGSIAGESDAEIVFEQVRVPKSNLISTPGSGFAIAQARLGPGRIHHCMRAIGAAEYALELMVQRAQLRITFGAHLADHGVVMDSIAQSRIEIEQARLLVHKAAWMMDTVGAKSARQEIAAIKVAAARMACAVIDRAIQVFGATGVSGDVPLAEMYAHARTLRLVDGPDEVHLRQIAKNELRRYEHLRPQANLPLPPRA